MADKTPTLVSPDGKRSWIPESATEAVNLRARGWSEQADEKTPAKSAPKS